MLRSPESTGAGAAMSAGKKIRILTANNASRKMTITAKGAIYWRKKLINNISKKSQTLTGAKIVLQMLVRI